MIVNTVHLDKGYLCGSRAYADGGHSGKKPYRGRIGIVVHRSDVYLGRSRNQQNEGVRGGHRYGGHGISFAAVMEDMEVTSEKKWFATLYPKDISAARQWEVKQKNSFGCSHLYMRTAGGQKLIACSRSLMNVVNLKNWMGVMKWMIPVHESMN